MAKWKFTAVPGVFTNLAEVQRQNVDVRITTQPHLGLLPRAYPTDTPDGDAKDWARFANYVRSLNRDAAPGEAYKVMYLTRHGFGYHNKKHTEVGTVEWDVRLTPVPPRPACAITHLHQRYWSHLQGDDQSTWFDALLTPEGIQQAQDLCTFWNNLIDEAGAPLPQTIYTSPLARCLQTSLHAFKPVMETHGAAFSPIVKEDLRERDTLHTCDKRRPRSWIEANWAGYRIEERLAEDDPFADRQTPESDAEHIARKQRAFEEIFDGDAGEFLELTIHSQAMWTVLLMLGEDIFRVREATSIALLVRGERVP